jgi:hypothetical protein
VTDNALGFLNRRKQPTIQTAIAKDAVKADIEQVRIEEKLYTLP